MDHGYHYFLFPVILPIIIIIHQSSAQKSFVNKSVSTSTITPDERCTQCLTIIKNHQN